MPKLKTHQGTKKRFKRTSTGKLLRRHAYGSHFLAKKSSARKRAYAKEYKVKGHAKIQVKRLLGE
ncbi:50S ribosomal protein L35 [Candidatus Microgenomates bacterium]|nr:50S ribosomal protein L35 [Candidatus Microgenomates bacterium]